jgi:hypothetical protein
MFTTALPATAPNLAAEPVPRRFRGPGSCVASQQLRGGLR